ncbi:MAG: tRNA preQ1(34) S-adenosylmethionine ribosyltransferase-isomerase QueA [Alphaproteobacteria bacterium]|nr:tRNA preQ1(34) S-adenosylmethionine ribosyltransferase-isomerase QueA [Alphaproteobacteria bacterium]
MDVSLFDFELPEAQIALRPAAPRDSARLMVAWNDGRIEHRRISDLPDYLQAGDTLLVNDTRVIPARLYGQRLREAGPARIEILLHRRLSEDRYAVLARPARKLAAGDALQFGALTAQVVSRGDSGEAEIRFALSGAALDSAIALAGEMPLPPYIAGKRKADARDASDYQTVFAREQGSVAAPTAGLHFTPELFAALEAKGVAREAVTLHVGLGTFLPVSAEDTSQHRMHAERALLQPAMAERLNARRAKGGRIAAVGTTSLRTLESAAGPDGTIGPFDGDTEIFITPGYQFRTAELLLTNFHLPRSTLFMLVSAFMGLDVMRRAYAEAVARGYRFYSYGDACLLMRTA